MKTYRCEQCPLRARYDNNPRSFLGRFWRFHIRFCPGWRGYMRSLSEEKRTELAKKYNL